MQKIIQALVKARLSIDNPKFDGLNPHFKNKFATLKACLAAVIPPLTENGIAFAQDFVEEDGRCICRTHLMHESGETLVFLSPPMSPVKTDPLGWASASTYARRYGVMGAMGIVGDPDDDGAAASRPGRKDMTEKEARKIADLMDAANIDTGEGCDAFGEAWLEMDQDEQIGFGKWFRNFYPGAVSKNKERMRDILAVYRENRNGESDD